MFAVLKTGGKQYRVQSGDVLRVEKLAAEAGDKVQFNDILMIGSTIGSPLVTGAGVVAEVIDTIKADKVITYHKRRRKHSSQRTRGHRQQLTLLRVTDLLESGADRSDVKAAVGARSGNGPRVKGDDRYAMNKTEQAEMARRVQSGEAAEKSAETDDKAAPSPVQPKNLMQSARDGRADDLKLISGIDATTESLLNENGVYHIDQIASWNGREIAYMDDKLSLGGRIQSEKWKQQAKKLAAEKEA